MATLSQPYLRSEVIQTNDPMRVLRVETGREFAIERYLTQFEFATVYVPSYEQKRITRSTSETLLKPLFPGYLFAAFGQPTFSLTVNAPHVYGLLRFGTRDAIIDDQEMQRIHTLGQFASKEPWEDLNEGDRVRIVSGPLIGSEGRMVRRRGSKRVAVEVSILNRIVPVEVDSWRIEWA